MVKTFGNEISWRGYIVVNTIMVLVVVLCFVMSGDANSKGDINNGSIFRYFGFVVLGVTIVQMQVQLLIRYEITQAELRVFPRWVFGGNSKIALSSITSIRPFDGFCHAVVTCAVRPLRVDFLKPNGRSSFVIISPRKKVEFLKELERRAPDLILSGDRLVRVSTPRYVG